MVWDLVLGSLDWHWSHWHAGTHSHGYPKALLKVAPIPVTVSMVVVLDFNWTRAQYKIGSIMQWVSTGTWVSVRGSVHDVGCTWCI